VFDIAARNCGLSETSVSSGLLDEGTIANRSFSSVQHPHSQPRSQQIPRIPARLSVV
jgi:hypothetical protein